MDDKQIIGLYFCRSEQAIEETASKYGRYCYSIAKSILPSHEDAEESVNDTYLDAWKSIPPHRPNSLKLFLGRITRRISIDRWRRLTAEKRGGGEMPLLLEELQECLADTSTPEKRLEQRELSRVLNNFVLSLPAPEQRVFLCRYWYMDSIRSISHRFGYSESKVKSMLHRTREKLRNSLQKEGY